VSCCYPEISNSKIPPHEGENLPSQNKSYYFNKKIGHISFYDSTGQRDTGIQKPYNEETGKLIDEEVRKLVSEAYQRTRELLQQNKESLQK
jgi:cell division protease FtsH